MFQIAPLPVIIGVCIFVAFLGGIFLGLFLEADEHDYKLKWRQDNDC